MINEAATSCLALAELSKQAIFSFDVKSKRFIYCNPAFKAHVPLDEDALSDANVNLLIHPEDAGMVKECYEKLMRKEERTTVEFRIVLTDKSVKTIRVEAFKTVVDDHRQVITGIMEDITAFREHSDTLNLFSNKKNSILNILSHDLLGPLGTIQNLSEIVSRKFTTPETQEILRFVNSIEKISKHSVSLIRNLLTREFLETAGAELVLRRTNIVAALREIVEQYKQSEETVKRTFGFSTTRDSILVDIDEPKLVQAINNLVSNALKFTGENGAIDIALKEEDKNILITVSDNGIGIPEKHHAALFDKFTNATRPGLHGEASQGLGMSIIKTIIGWHHGEIWFESRENVGTTFYIRIPCHK